MIGIRSIAVVGVVIVALAGMSLFTVSETEHAIRFRFREIIQDDFQPGLHLKFPWENALKLDKRILTIDGAPSEFLTDQKEKVFVDFMVKWRIVDAGQFYRATGGIEQVAAERLVPIIEAGLKDEFASRDLSDLVSVERSEVMQAITSNASDLATQFGAEVRDVRIKRIDLSDDVSDTVFNRMKQERKRVAFERRAEGQGQAERIRAETDKDRTVILANAYRESQEIRGEGDAQSAAIYAEAYQRDPEFYSFYRSMQAYRRAFEGGQDVLVLGPDNEFFKYLQTPAKQ